MDLPPHREGIVPRILEWAGVWAPPLVAFGFLSVWGDRHGNGLFRGSDRDDIAVPVLFAIFFQPAWLCVPWLFRLWSRAGSLAESGRRADLYLASVSAEAWLRRMLGPPIRRFLIGVASATTLWFALLAACLLPMNQHWSADDQLVVALFLLVFLAEQFAAAALVLLATGNLLARRLEAGATSSAALSLGFHAIALFAGPIAFLLLSVWVFKSAGEGSMFILPTFAWGFAALLARAASARRDRVIRSYYDFE